METGRICDPDIRAFVKVLNEEVAGNVMSGKKKLKQQNIEPPVSAPGFSPLVVTGSKLQPHHAGESHH